MTAALLDLKPGVYRKGEAGFIEPGSPLHSKVISPSKVAAIMNVSRWESEFRLWHRMTGRTDPEPDRDDFHVGHALELTLAYLWREENPGWSLSRGEVQIVGDSSRFGFPYIVTLDRRANRGSLRQDVEFKSCRSWDDWGDDGTDEAPPDYLLQVITQMLLSGFTKVPAHLMVMNRFGCMHHTYTIEFIKSVAEEIIESCREFYNSLSLETPPPLDDSVATYECVREQHPDIDKGAEGIIADDLAAEFHESIAALKAAEDRERFARTRVLDAIARANFAKTEDGIRVARRQPSGKGAVALYQIKPGSQASIAGLKAKSQAEEVSV